MNITIEQHNLQTLLARVIGAVSKRGTIPILSNVKLVVTNDYLQATTTDLDMEITADAPAETPESFETTVNAATLAGIVSKLPKGSLVALHLEDGFLHVEAGRSKFKLATLPVDDFPEMASGEYEASLEFPGLELKNALDKTVWASSTEETRYYLQGVAVQHREGRANMIATDGHRLAWLEGEECAPFADIIIPTAAVKQFIAALYDGTATMDISQTKVRLTHDNVVIVSKVIDGTFPDWTRVLPKNTPNSVTMASMDAKSAIERVSLVATDRTRAVKLSIADNDLTFLVSDANGGDAQEVIEAETDGESLTIGLNGKYALDALAQADKGTVTVSYSDPTSPMLIKYDKEPGLTAVVMPLRVN